MDSLILLIINIGVGTIAGIASAVKAYKEKKSRKKLKKRIAMLEEEKAQEHAQAQATHEPVETPSECGYQKPDHATPYIN